MSALARRLFAPIDIASLACFRVLFGVIMIWEVCRYFGKEWIRTHWISPEFLFKYYGFDWVRPWSGDGMYVHFLALGILAFFIAIGFLYRISAVLFFLGFTYVFLLDQAHYLNHFYLVSLISFLLIFIPAHRSASVDAWLRPRLHRNEAPTWTLWILRAQLVVVYFYAGVAKINADWLRGEPMRMWLARREDLTLLGPLGRLLTEEWVVYLFTYGGLLLDLLIAPLLLWRRSRPYALAAVIVFHLLNAVLFQIGIFPWFMIAATLLFLPPDWPRRICNWPKGADAFPQEVPLRTHRVRPTLAPLAVYLFIQIVVPLRHLLYPGSVHWTEEGHRFSWHMKLRDKKGDADFHLNDPDTGKTWTVNPRRRLSATQVSKMSSRPDMILQFAHFLAMEQRDKGRSRIEVRAEVMVSLNGREPAPLVDPTVDLAAQARTLAHVSWILPLTKPLADTAAKRAAETDREQAGENSTAE